MGPNGLYFKLIYHDDIIYECWISSRFILMHKDVLEITQGFTEDNEQGLWIN